MLNVFQSFFISTFNASKVTFIHFYLNGGLHTFFMGKPSERMSNFWTVRFLETESEQNFGFPHIPMNYYRMSSTDVISLISGLVPTKNRRCLCV